MVEAAVSHQEITAKKINQWPRKKQSMNVDIIEKLNKHIEEGFNREADIVYLLVQSRKILERDEKQQDFPVLNFYANWVAHPKLSRLRANPAMEQIFEKFDKSLKFRSSGEMTKATEMLKDSISLQKLNTEIREFLNTQDNFNKALLEKSESWANFGGLLIDVLTDLPLEAPNGHYEFIKMFSFTKPKPRASRPGIEITLQSGEVLTGIL